MCIYIKLLGDGGIYPVHLSHTLLQPDVTLVVDGGISPVALFTYHTLWYNQILIWWVTGVSPLFTHHTSCMHVLIRYTDPIQDDLILNQVGFMHT